MEQQITHPAILIRINRLYKPAMGRLALYEATRGEWRLGKRRERARLALAIYKGVVRGVYEIDSWHPAGSTKYTTRDISKFKLKGRWEFMGREARTNIKEHYVGLSVSHYFRKGSRNPIGYANCPSIGD